MSLKEGEDPDLYVIIFGTNSFFPRKTWKIIKNIRSRLTVCYYVTYMFQRESIENIKNSGHCKVMKRKIQVNLVNLKISVLIKAYKKTTIKLWSL